MFTDLYGCLRWLRTFVFTDLTEGEHVSRPPGKLQPAVHEGLLHHLVTVEVDSRVGPQVHRHHVSVSTTRYSVVRQV